MVTTGVRQYGAILKSTIAGQSTIDQETGAIITTPDVSIEVKCRYQPNPSAKVIKTTDGQTVIYRGTCYVKKGEALELSNGDLVSVDGFINEPIPVLQIQRRIRTRIIL